MNVINDLGAVAIFFTLAFLKIFRPKQIREIIQQVFYIGAKSSNIVMFVLMAFILLIRPRGLLGEKSIFE